MSSPDGEVRITRSERLRIPRERDKTRIAKLKAFKSRISAWTEPSTIVYDKPVIVCLSAWIRKMCRSHQQRRNPLRGVAVPKGDCRIHILHFVLELLHSNNAV